MRILPLALLTAGIAALLFSSSYASLDLPPAVKDAEARRIAAVEKAKPAVVAVFAPGGAGGGSGVLIDEEGYALTNFHVVEGSGPVMQCGLSDGVLYDAVLVGLDKVGDVALIKLVPKKDGIKFPFAKMGDSDKVQVGDWSLAMGNPFLLATDFNPTVTFGLVSGVNRYQHPAGLLLEYTDCIQIDTSINPGNSGGPLFNLEGEIIGINGRGSFEKRGRVNSGVGYAISINQIKNFLGALRAGLDTDHASLGALVADSQEEGDGAVGRVVVTNILENSDAFRRGLNIEDEIVRFAGRPIGTRNQFKNAMGLYPRGWRVPLTFRHNDEKAKDPKLRSYEREILVRLMGVLPHELRDPKEQPQPNPNPNPGPGPRPGQPPKPSYDPNSPAAKLYEAKSGFANYHFNKLMRDKLLADFFAKTGSYKGLDGLWTLEGDGQIGNRSTSVKVTMEEVDKLPKITFTQGGDLSYVLNPLSNGKEDLDHFQDPPGSGGLMMALFHYRQLLTKPVESSFEAEFRHGGSEPFYPPAEGKPAMERRVLADVLVTKTSGVETKWYFSPKDHTLLGFETAVKSDNEDDPCEVYLSDYREVNKRLLPHRMDVYYHDQHYATLKLNKIDLK